MNRLRALHHAGVSIWLDTLSRELLESGAFAAMIAEDAVTGATSNPTIFAKAIGGSDRYDEQLRASVAAGTNEPRELFFTIALDDVGRAADLLLPVHEASGGRDGYVSFECTPDLADDTAATVEQALELWARLARPNVMIKVPATDAGVPAIEELTARGVNVNITLLFSVARYEQVIGAYMAGLERRVRAGQPVGAIASVASFFVSRIDAKVDPLLPADSSLRGRVAIANAQCRLPPLPGAVRRRALERAARRRGARAAAAVGQHRHEGRGLLRRPLRRGADRARRDQHHARRHAARLRRPRRRHPRVRRGAGPRPPRRFTAPGTPASTCRPSPRRSNARACAPSATPTRSCSRASGPHSRCRSRPRRRSTGVAQAAGDAVDREQHRPHERLEAPSRRRRRSSSTWMNESGSTYGLRRSIERWSTGVAVEEPCLAGDRQHQLARALVLRADRRPDRPRSVSSSTSCA